MSSLRNRAGCLTTTQGTGPLALGAALAAGAVPYAASWLTFDDAGVQNGETVRYLILDSQGRWEFGPGVYNSVTGTLSRPASTMSGTIPGQRSSTGVLLALSGTSQVFIAAVAEDLIGSGGGGGVAPTVNVIIPITGFSLTVSDNTELVLDPAGMLAAGTVTLPAAPTVGLVGIRSTQPISTFTLTPGVGQSVKWSPGTLAASQKLNVVYNAGTSTWYTG